MKYNYILYMYNLKSFITFIYSQLGIIAPCNLVTFMLIFIRL